MDGLCNSRAMKLAWVPVEKEAKQRKRNHLINFEKL